MLVEIESKKGHDKLLEKVLTKIKVDDLYVKLEKCKLKVREVGFLEVVMRPGKIKIEEEKIKTVLNWLVSKSVKKVQKFFFYLFNFHF